MTSSICCLECLGLINITSQNDNMLFICSRYSFSYSSRKWMPKKSSLTLFNSFRYHMFSQRKHSNRKRPPMLSMLRHSWLTALEPEVCATWWEASTRLQLVPGRTAERTMSTSGYWCGRPWCHFLRLLRTGLETLYHYCYGLWGERCQFTCTSVIW